MSEGGGLNRDTGHRPAKRTELCHCHHARGTFEILEDRFYLRAINVIEEHGAGGGHWVVITLFWRINFRVFHRFDHICNRCSERAERRNDTLAFTGITRVDQHRHNDELAVIFGRQERHGWCRHYIRNRRELFGWGLCQGYKRSNRIGCRGQEEHPSENRVNLVQSELKAGHDTKIASAAANCPEEIRVHILIYMEYLTICGHNFSRKQIINRETIFAY